MKQAQALSGIVVGGAVSLLATQPVWAASTQVTGVQLNPGGKQLELILETKSGEENSKISTVKRGNDLVADITNARLNLQEGESFRQENPLPGISKILVSQSDDNRVQVIVSGTFSPPTGEIRHQDTARISLNLSAVPENKAESQTHESNAALAALPKNEQEAIALSTSTEAIALSTPTKAIAPSTPTSSSAKQTSKVEKETQLAQVQGVPKRPTVQTQAPQPIPLVPPNTPAPGQVTPPAPQVPLPGQVIPSPRPDVLIPNPRITIDGTPAQAAGAAQPIAPAPPFLPRAVAPPLGDVAVSNINASASYIDLGTAARVPRLVLREAPVREVLSLLARAAGLNVAFTGEGGAGAPGAPTAGAQKTISLDLENESVQNAFNYVLQVSGLQANRVGNTILVGSQLPDTARNIISRSLRLNQVSALQATNFLISQGAEQQQVVTQTTLTVVGEGAAAQRITNTTTSVQRVTPPVEPQTAGGPGATPPQAGPQVLRGLSVTPDIRLNAVTVVGEPRKIEIATALLSQLDLRRRQVAVNVKVVDVNLQGIDAFNTSFSFGIGNAFFSSDGGAASFNYGGTRPPTQLQVNTSSASPPVISNPYSGSTIFLDPNNSISIPGTAPGTTRINSNGQITITAPGSASFYTPVITLNNPLQPGFTNITPATNNVVTFNADGTTTVTAGTLGTATVGLPSLFQFPKKLLTALQAQITSNNAKILTDPTLVVQEGQVAKINLTQEVVGNVKSETQSTNNQTTRTVTAEIREAGLILEVAVDRIDDNGFISLTVNPRVTSIGANQNLSVDNNTNTIALLNVRQLTSGLIRLRDSQTLILSGIIQESDRTTVKKVPILGDIPILGALFRSTERSNQRNEIIVLLTPQIIQDAAGSSFGYNYTPGQETRQMLQRQGVNP